MGKMSTCWIWSLVYFHTFEALKWCFWSTIFSGLHFYTLPNTLIPFRTMQLRFFLSEKLLNNAFNQYPEIFRIVSFNASKEIEKIGVYSVHTFIIIFPSISIQNPSKYETMAVFLGTCFPRAEPEEKKRRGGRTTDRGSKLIAKFPRQRVT